MSGEREYRQDDVRGRGYCPRCHRVIAIDVALFGVCEEHGRVPADFARPEGWSDPDDREAYEATDPKHPDYHDLMSDLADL